MDVEVEGCAVGGTGIPEGLDDSPCVGMEGILAGGAPEDPEAKAAAEDLVVGLGEEDGAVALRVDPGVEVESVRAALAGRQDLRANRGSPEAVVDSMRGLASVPTSASGMGSRKIGPLLSVAVGVSEPESGGAYSLSDEDEDITRE